MLRFDDDFDHVAFLGVLGSNNVAWWGHLVVVLHFFGHQERPIAEPVGLRHHVCLFLKVIKKSMFLQR